VSWTIFWDMHPRPGNEGWSKATEHNEGEALQRAGRFVKLGFVVYEIRGPDGVVVHDKAAIRKRFKPVHGPESPHQQAPMAAATTRWSRDSR
jgi:hypothetical protein